MTDKKLQEVRRLLIVNQRILDANVSDKAIPMPEELEKLCTNNNQAIALLDKEKCPTCEEAHTTSCPDCQEKPDGLGSLEGREYAGREVKVDHCSLGALSASRNICPAETISEYPESMPEVVKEPAEPMSEQAKKDYEDYDCLLKMYEERYCKEHINNHSLNHKCPLCLTDSLEAAEKQLKAEDEPAETVSEFRLKVTNLKMHCDADINHTGEIRKIHKELIWQYLEEACTKLESPEKQRMDAEKAQWAAVDEVKQLKAEIKANNKCRIFVKHIYTHLEGGQQVCCKICDKTITQIWDEQALKEKSDE